MTITLSAVLFLCFSYTTPCSRSSIPIFDLENLLGGMDGSSVLAITKPNLSALFSKSSLPFIDSTYTQKKIVIVLFLSYMYTSCKAAHPSVWLTSRIPLNMLIIFCIVVKGID